MIERRNIGRRNGVRTSSTVFSTLWICVFAVAVALVSGCTHHTDAAHELDSAVAPFSQSRDQAVGVVTTAKHSLGASDLNTLAATYEALEEKGNAYAGFLVEAVSATSFDADRNAKYSSNLIQAIKTFNKSFASVSPPNQAGVKVESAWVPPFSDAVAAYWKQYQSALSELSPQAKADLIKELKSKTVWPNYENIATQPVAVPTSH